MSAAFDVVIYELATMRVDAVIGREMKLWDGEGNGRNTADLRKHTALERINDKYTAAIVTPGIYEKGSILMEGHIIS